MPEGRDCIFQIHWPTGLSGTAPAALVLWEVVGVSQRLSVKKSTAQRGSGSHTISSTTINTDDNCKYTVIISTDGKWSFFNERHVIVMKNEDSPDDGPSRPGRGKAMQCAVRIHETSFQPAPLRQLCLGAAWPPVFSLQNKIQNIILQIWTEEMPEMTNKNSFF